MTRLRAEQITVGYHRQTAVIHDLSIDIPDGAVTTIIGPNGCGKSTILRTLVRLLPPSSGTVLLDGQAIVSRSTKEVARQLGILSQQPTTLDAITVEDLARRGRYPHQAMLQPLTERDQQAVERALELAGMTELRGRSVDELSGGQRQRAWIAMALAQETPLLLLDEPTTYLDIAHQQEILRLIRRLNQEEGRTIVMVLHDINSAAEVSDHIVAMRDGEIVGEGPPESVLQPSLLEEVFGIACDVIVHPETGAGMPVARSRIDPCRPTIYRERSAPALSASGLATGYGARRIIDDLNLTVPTGRITAIVGPNGCGKSTLLRTFARLLPRAAGEVRLGDEAVESGSHRAFARQLAMLTQGASTPAEALVEDLVAIGRYPYQRWYRQWSPTDQEAIERAMSAADVLDLRWHPVDGLSGGQRQRVWLAMTLAQETPVLLLDEPTTFLDIAHQVEMLDLVWTLNRDEGRTVVMVLHDLSHACRYADHLVVMREGHVVAAGSPTDVMTESLLREVFGFDGCVVADDVFGTPVVLSGGVSRTPDGLFVNECVMLVEAGAVAW